MLFVASSLALATLQLGSQEPIPLVGRHLEAGLEVDYASGTIDGTGALLFYALYTVLGERAFDEIIGGWFRGFRDRGSTTPEFVGYVRDRAGPAVERIFDDWLYSARWYERLRAAARRDEIIGGSGGPP